jgi:hypothetical protein
MFLLLQIYSEPCNRGSVLKDERASDKGYTPTRGKFVVAPGTRMVVVADIG